MRKFVPPMLLAVVAIGFIYFRTLASVEEFGELVPEPSPEASAALETELERAAVPAPPQATTERVPLEASAQPRARPPALRGRVLTPDGKPYGWGKVRFARVARGRAALEQTLTISDGSFELAPADPEARGDLLVTASRHEFAPVALLGVMASHEELELRLLPANTFELRLRDQHGVELEPAKTSFHWVLAEVTREDDESVLGKLRWARSPVPFRIHVHDDNMIAGWFGPFEPSAVGDVLVLDVHRRAFVSGIVVTGGAPVPGAEVRLEPQESADAATRFHAFGSSRTNERGEFRFRVDQGGAFRAIAFDARHGRGLGPQLVCNGLDDIGVLTVDLTEPSGRIEGRILVPEGTSPFVLAVELGPRVRTPRTDGSFLLPNIEPGRHVLRLVRGEPSAPRNEWTFRTHEPVPWLGYTPAWNVEVLPGATSEVVLDLVTPPLVRLEGRIDLGVPVSDAGTFGNRAASGVHCRRDDEPGLASQAFLDEEGEFAIAFAAPGRCRLAFSILITDGGPSWTVNDLVDLEPGVTRWDLTLRPGALRLLAPDEELEFEPEPVLHWQGEDQLTIDVPGSIRGLVESSPGALLYHAVPPGVVHFTLAPGGTAYSAVVRSDETSEFRLPESARAELRAAYDVRSSGIQVPSYLIPAGHY